MPYCSNNSPFNLSMYEPLREIVSNQIDMDGQPMVMFIARFMSSPKQPIQRECVGCLCELSEVKGG